MASATWHAPGLRALFGVAGLASVLTLAVFLAARGCQLLTGGSLEQEMRRAWELQMRTTGHYHRSLEKLRIAQAVSEGRLSLLEAAALNLALNRLPPAFEWDSFHRQYPTGSDEERLCRAVIDLVEAVQDMDDPCLALALRESLERELQGHLLSGPLRLPELPGAPSENALWPSSGSPPAAVLTRRSDVQ